MSSSGSCLSDEVIYGTDTILGIGGVLKMIALGRWEPLRISDVSTVFQDCACKHLVENCLSRVLQILLPTYYLAKSGLKNVCLMYQLAVLKSNYVHILNYCS